MVNMTEDHVRRSEPLPEFPERKRRWPGKKDTKRWCKGVVGREHKLKTVRWPIGSNWINAWFVDLCTVCGKQFNLRSKK